MLEKSLAESLGFSAKDVFMFIYYCYIIREYETPNGIDQGAFLASI